MPDQLILKFQDFDGDSQRTAINVQDVDDAVDFTTWRSALIVLGNEINKWEAGRNQYTGLNITQADNGAGSATSPIAQSSTQLILKCKTP